MKKSISLISFLMISSLFWAQSPSQLSYQAILRTGDNTLLTNQTVSLMINILKDSESGDTVYSEVHDVLSNQNGLVTLEIGAGSVLMGDFTTIAWGNNMYYIQTSIDLLGGSDYTLIGATLCQSVPYSFYANSADTITGTIAASQITGLNEASLGDGVINALNYGIKADGVTDNTAAIKALLELADGERIYFPAGVYRIDSLESAVASIYIDGIYPRYIDGSLHHGTVFTGKMSFTGTNVRITNIGVDLSGSDADDGLRVTPAKIANSNVGEFCDLHNIITVGANRTSPYHSFLVEGFDQVHISNIEVRDAYMGVILKVEGGIISDIRAYNIDRESLFIKSDNVFGYCMDLVVDKVYVENNSSPLSTGIKVLSSGAQLENVSLSNIFIRRTQIGISIISAGHNGVMINNVNVNNVKIDYPSLYGIYLEANKGSVENVNISNVDITHAKNILTTLGAINYFNFSGVNANILSNTTADQKGKIITIGANTVGTNLSNITVLNGHDVDPSLAILYNNEGRQNRITNYNLKLRGGVPTSGQSMANISNTEVNSLLVENNTISNKSIISIVPNGDNAEVDTISVYPNSSYTQELFPLGYELLLQNSSEYNLVINHNPEGNIEHPENLDITLAPHAFIKYVFNGDSWIKEE